MQRIQPDAHYQPHRLFDAICRIRGLKTDSELAEFLAVGRPLISKVRRGYLPLSAGLLLRIHEVTVFDIKWLKEMMGDRRAYQRTSDNKLVVTRARSNVDALPYNRSAAAPQTTLSGRR